MTLEELSRAYYAAYWGIDTNNNNERDIAGIRAVVEALRDEVCGFEWPENVQATFDEILEKRAVRALG